MAGNRRSIRLPEYDYRSAGAYFVTVCAFERQELFGEVVDDRVVLNVFGMLLVRIWARTLSGGQSPEPHDFVVMPNHVHGVVWLPGARDMLSDTGARARRLAEGDALAGQDGGTTRMDEGVLVDGSPLRRVGLAPGSLGAVVGAFKRQAARAINRAREWPGGPLWQRGYYERVLRANGELARVRQYILDNPAKWAADPNGPTAVRTSPRMS
jgi:REP element-mobilizing transposase RayT